MKKRCFLLVVFCVLLFTSSCSDNRGTYSKKSTECFNSVDLEVVLVSEFGRFWTSGYENTGVGVVSFKIGDVLYGVGHYCNVEYFSEVHKTYPQFIKGNGFIGRATNGRLVEKESLLGEVIYKGEDGVLLSTKNFNTDEYQTIKVADRVVSGNAELLIRDETRTLNSYSVIIEIIVEDGKERLELCITDQRLLEKTGGILKGMSGSPILQDGKLVGILTQVYEHSHYKGKAKIIWEIDCIKKYIKN